MKNEPPVIGIIGGSGLYQMEEVRDAAEHKIDTPFGSPIGRADRRQPEGPASFRVRGNQAARLR